MSSEMTSDLIAMANHDDVSVGLPVHKLVIA